MLKATGRLLGAPSWTSLLLLLALLLTQWAQRAEAQQQCVNENAPAPLEICVHPWGNYQVWVQQPNGRMPQYSEASSAPIVPNNGWMIRARLGDVVGSWGEYIPTYSTASPSTNTVTGTGSPADPYVLRTEMSVAYFRVVQELIYINGERSLRKRWTITDNFGPTFTDLRFIAGGDTAFSGWTYAYSWYDNVSQMVYHSYGEDAGYMGFVANPATPADGHFAGANTTGKSAANNPGELPSPLSGTLSDSGYYLQWNRPSFSIGDKWIIEATEVWSVAGPVQLFAPVASNVRAGTQHLASFTIKNTSNSAVTADLALNMSGSWTASTPQTQFQLAAGESVQIPITVSTPADATGTQTLEVNATDGTAAISASTQLTVANMAYSVSPHAASFGAANVGANSSQTLTFTNAGPTLTLGHINATRSLGAAYSLSDDQCSYKELAGGASCSITLVHTPTSPAAMTGTLQWPVVAPVMMTLSSEVSATTGGYIIYSEVDTGSGSVTPTNAVVASGAQSTFTVQPAAHYQIDQVTGCNGTLVGDQYTTDAITGNCTVRASFSRIQLTVDTTIQGLGMIGPASATVYSGDTRTFTIAPWVGHSIVSVTGCGGTLVGAQYTTAPVTSACTVSVVIERNSYDVSSNLIGEGNISPARQQIAHGDTATFVLSPSVGSHLASIVGCAGSLNGSTYTTGPVTGACSVSAQFAKSPPRFTTDTSDPLDFDATGLFTELPTSLYPLAVDGRGDAITTELATEPSRFLPGQHHITWQATDATGHRISATQVLNVWPIVNVGPDIALGQRRGNDAAFTIALNGPAPSYPFDVYYTVDPELPELDLRAGFVRFEAGETQKQVHFAFIDAPAANTPDRTIEITLQSSRNLAVRHSVSVALTNENLPPVVALLAQRNGEPSVSFARKDGPVSVLARIEDANSQDTHSVSWTLPPQAVVEENGKELIIDPTSLNAGIHRISAWVVDTGSPSRMSQAVLDLVIEDDPPTLPPGTDGWLISGLPNHVDYALPMSNVLPALGGDLNRHLLETDAGLSLALGAYARRAQRTQAMIELSSTDIPADTFPNVGGYFDFVVHGLTVPGQQANIVLPQQQSIPARALYRKYDAEKRSWYSFVVNANNSVASAPGAPGFCPPPVSVSYRDGLHEGDWCVRLTIEDGGPNDTDGSPNGVINDPGGVGTAGELPAPPSIQPRRSGGGGSMNWLLLLTAGLCGLRAWSKERS